MATFNGAIDAHVAIVGPQCSGGIMNFNFGGQKDEQKKKVEPFSTVPFAPDPDFVDRPEIIGWLHDKCAGAGARAALVGLGGVGKSQLALQYVHSIRTANPQTFVFWVHASTGARFEEAYRDIADRLQLPGRDDPETNVLRLVSDWLRDETNGQWVMVIDNADNVETFRQRDGRTQTPLATFVPQNRGVVLVTSRSKDAAFGLVGGYNRLTEVLAMSQGEGLQLLRNKLRHPPAEESALELLRELNHIPLAITQAAAYIGRGARMTVTRYIEEFRKSTKKQECLLRWDAGELRRDASASNSIVTTWQMSFEQIQRERQSAADLLSLMSFFNPQGIPMSALQRCRKLIGVVDVEEKEEAESAFNEDIDTLQAYSLVSVTANADTCEMHALVQFCTQLWLESSGDTDHYQLSFLLLMAAELPTGEYQNWKKCQQLLPHVEPLFSSEPTTGKALEAWAQLLTKAAWYLWQQGQFKLAEELAEKALAADERQLGPENERTLISSNMLAVVLESRGEYEKAEVLHRRALARAETELGRHHNGTLRIAQNLTSVLLSQGRYAEAEPLIRRALEGFRRFFGEEHLVTLSVVGGLARVLRAQGKYKKAEELNRQALAGYEKGLGRDHPDTLTIIHNLVTVLQCQCKYEEAEILGRRALASRKKVLGERHPTTFTNMDNLATVLLRQGKLKEAEVLQQEALERRKELGEQDPATLTSMSNLALTLQYQGKYDDAERLNRQALEVRKRVLGEQHPDTLVSMSNLAGVLQHQAVRDERDCKHDEAELKYLEAEQLNRQSLKGRTEVLRN
ncbi:hypothetical protein E8E13_002869 [Curvularia kusanoi]|uniref:TPR-like protein n=1 Tax=Curvularia kusanoi TaxID=90978 RepID=A0A9P4T4M8_CURKU|nr:hypothetical protein E8E13_002869 [Curvularia kusanoi]